MLSLLYPLFNDDTAAVQLCTAEMYTYLYHRYQVESSSLLQYFVLNHTAPGTGGSETQ